jgi:hypothetical protein
MGTEQGKRITESELRRALAVSKVTLWNWRRSGMPVLSEGVRGRENVYCMESVIGWLTRSGFGMRSMETLARIGALADQARAPARADVCTKPSAMAVARAIALARVQFAEDFPNWGYDEVTARTAVELVDIFVEELLDQLAGVGLKDVQQIVHAAFDEQELPDDLNEIIARFRTEVPGA